MELDLHSCLVVWRGQKFVVELKPNANFKELGDKLQELTNVKSDTLRLFVPMEKDVKLIYPFSDEHARLILDTSVLKGKSIRMMGVPKNEVDEVLKNAKVDLRIAGFEEEEKRLKLRNADRSYTPKLPQGNYIFCDFRTLSLPGIELNPPASKALELLHKLASDPGIVAIMNKHRWRVGILTEMAPIGYVGVSPKCILGFNTNHGEEISLRLRTDDLKGFRKYQSIKKTLLHELAHMVFSEHDSNFHALNSQLNKEAAALDWTKSRGHTLTGAHHSRQNEEEFDISSNTSSSHKLGGHASVNLNARDASVNAAFQRLATVSTSDEVPELSPLPGAPVHLEHNMSEPDPDDCENDESMESTESSDHVITAPHESQTHDSRSDEMQTEPDPDAESMENTMRLDKTAILNPTTIESPNHVGNAPGESESHNSHADEMQTVPDCGGDKPRSWTVEPDPDDPELQIIQDPVAVLCGRLQSAIESLKKEVKLSEAKTVLQTLIKIVSNVIEHPDEMKFKKLRKANPMIQRNIVAYKAAMDILTLIGFAEDATVDDWGRAETVLMLKRNDPGLLWLAKSSLETNMS